MPSRYVPQRETKEQHTLVLRQRTYVDVAIAGTAAASNRFGKSQNIFELISPSTDVQAASTSGLISR